MNTKTLYRQDWQELVAGNDGVRLAHPFIPSLYLATFPLPHSPMRHREHALCSHLHLHIHTHNWFLISLCWRGIKSCAGKNCCRMEPCSGWRERKGSSKKPLSLRFRQTRVGTEATEAARGQWVSSLRVSAEPRMEAALSTAGRLHRCRNSDSRRLRAQRLLMFKVGRWKTRDLGTGCRS